MEELDFIEIEKLEEDDDQEVEKKVLEEDIINKYTDGQLRIVRTTMDFPLNNLKQILEDETYLKVNPSYQRRNRWDRKKKSLLIESLLMNIPVPPVFLFEKEYNSYEVMDGLQRLRTIQEFLSNKFKLCSLDYWEELNGKTFDKLPDILKRGLLRRTISAIVLLAESTREISDTDIRMVLFKRLNTGGIQLNPHELRNALYPGNFNNMILEVSRDDEFTTIWGIPKRADDEDINPSKELVSNVLYKNMYDCEIVLRFFAIRDAMRDDIKGSLRRLLDLCMMNHSKDDESTVNMLSELFINTLKELKSIFSSDLFMLPRANKISIPLYDALTVAYSLIEDKSKLLSNNTIKDNLKKHLDDPKGYEILTGKLGTSQSIRDRVKLATEILIGE